MKKYLVFGLLTSLLLTSCSIDWSDEKEKKIGALEKQLTEMKKEDANDIFKKNLECSTLFDKIESFAQEFYGEKTQIKNIFYSPKRNSCLFIIYVKRLTFEDQSIYIVDIMDILSRESIYWIDSKEMFFYKDVIDSNCYWMEEKCNSFNQKLKELKWE